MSTPRTGVCADTSTAGSKSYSPGDKTLDRLVDYSQRDKPWDVHRQQTSEVGEIYAGHQEFSRYAERMSECSGLLRFGWDTDKTTGETALRLREAQFCRVRHCPVCQWRRSLMWQARFLNALPEIVEAHPKARWIFLTLTVRNCDITDLGETIQHMNQSWQRLKERKDFRPVLGWVRTTEVTKNRKDGSAHPHFHALMMVPPSWFKGQTYVKHARWVDLWRDCLRVDYDPNVDVRVVKPKVPKGEAPATGMDAQIAALQAAAAETLKYSTKPSDMTDDGDADGWFLELTRQTHRKRFIATGGVLKNVLKETEEETDDDLIGQDGEGSDDDEAPHIAFGWRASEGHYRRNRKRDC